MTRSVSLANIRRRKNLYGKNRFDIVTGPRWAYRRKRDWYWLEPNPAAWRNVLKTLPRRADADYEERLAEYQKQLKEAADPNNEGMRKLMSLGWLPREPKRFKVTPPDCDSHYRRMYRCAAVNLWDHRTRAIARRLAMPSATNHPDRRGPGRV
jgi:hypothetical protein